MGREARLNDAKDLPPRGLPGQDQRLLIRNVFVDPNDPRSHGPVNGVDLRGRDA